MLLTLSLSKEESYRTSSSTRSPLNAFFICELILVQYLTHALSRYHIIPYRAVNPCRTGTSKVRTDSVPPGGKLTTRYTDPVQDSTDIPLRILNNAATHAVERDAGGSHPHPHPHR